MSEPQKRMGYLTTEKHRKQVIVIKHWSDGKALKARSVQLHAQYKGKWVSIIQIAAVMGFGFSFWKWNYCRLVSSGPHLYTVCELNYHCLLHDHNVCLLISYTVTIYEWDMQVAFSFNRGGQDCFLKVGKDLEVNIKPYLNSFYI